MSNIHGLDLKTRINKLASFKQLGVFVKIVECRSFSKAAIELNLTTSAVSRSLSQLESQLEILLVKRTTRHLALTEAGQYLYDRMTQLLLDLDESLDKTSSFHEHPKGQLSITCSFAFGYDHVIDLFNDYNQKYPDIDLLIDLNDSLVNLNEKDFDLALRITNHPPDNYATRKITPIHWVYCASYRYLETYGIPLCLADLQSHRCLVYPSLAAAWQYENDQGEPVSLNIRKTIQANSSLVLLKAALHHQGIAYLPTYAIGNHIQSGELKPILLNEMQKGEMHALYALYFPSRYQNPKVRTFIDFILEKLSPIAPWDHWRS